MVLLDLFFTLFLHLRLHIMQLFMFGFILVVQVVRIISAMLHPDGFNYQECPHTETRCEYWLVIQEKLTMIYDRNLVYAHKGKLYLYNEHFSNYTTEVIA